MTKKNESLNDYTNFVAKNPRIDIPISSKEVIYPNRSRLEYLEALSIRVNINIKTLVKAWLNDNEVAYDIFLSYPTKQITYNLILACWDVVAEVEYRHITEPISNLDPILLSSVFAWNSTSDSYNYIYGIKRIWEEGLGKLTSDLGVNSVEITQALKKSLIDISAISDLDIKKTILGTQKITEDNAFRNQMQDFVEIKKIKTAQKSIKKLEIILEDAVEILLKRLKTPTKYESQITSIVKDININNSRLKQYIKSIAENEIRPNFRNLRTQSNALKDAIKKLVKTPTAKNLTTAREAWKRVRSKWNIAQAYYNSTVSSLAYAVDMNIDCYSIRLEEIERNIDSWNGTVYAVEDLTEDQKGLKIIEYLLFGDGETLESAEDGIDRLKNV